MTTDRDPLDAYVSRHSATQHAMRWLVPNPRLPEEAFAVASIVWVVAEDLVSALGDGPELSAGLRKLREAMDCFVIQALEDQR